MTIKDDFPIFKQKFDGKDLIYLDSAATTQKPYAMIEALNDFYSNSYGTVHRAIYHLSSKATDRYNQSREKIKEFLNASFSEEIVITKGTTDAINLVANTFITPQSTVIVPDIEHHSNIVPWQIRKVCLKRLRTDESGQIDHEHLKELLEEGANLLSLAHLSNTLGVVHPIKDIIKLAHSYGTKVLVDAAQSVAHQKIDVQDLDVDFLAFSGHKIYGPNGVGVLYGKRDLLKQMPPYQGGGDMIARVGFDETTFNEPPLRFEAGTPPIAEVIALGSSIDYMKSIGIEKAREIESHLLDTLLTNLNHINSVKILGNPKKCGSLLSFVVDGLHPLDIGTLLDLNLIAVRTGHLCSQPTMQKFDVGSVIRVSFGIYNTKEDVDFFSEKLESIIKKLH
jgi:cysteine desulfurase/selenocysteine lyase